MIEAFQDKKDFYVFIFAITYIVCSQFAKSN